MQRKFLLVLLTIFILLTTAGCSQAADNQNKPAGPAPDAQAQQALLTALKNAAGYWGNQEQTIEILIRPELHRFTFAFRPVGSGLAYDGGVRLDQKGRFVSDFTDKISSFDYFYLENGQLIGVTSAGTNFSRQIFSRQTARNAAAAKQGELRKLKLLACRMHITGQDGSQRSLSLERLNEDGGTVALTVSLPPNEAPRHFTATCSATPFEGITALTQECNLLTWPQLPQRRDAAADTYRAGVLLKFDQTELNFSSDQELPQLADYVFFHLYTLMRYYLPEGEAYPPFPLGAKRQQDTVVVQGQEVQTIAGSGDITGQGAILNYGNRKWWQEEGCVGCYTLVPEACPSEGRVKSAALEITEGGSIRLNLNGQVQEGRLKEERRNGWAYGCSFAGSFSYLDEAGRTLKFHLPPQPYPESRPSYTFILKRVA